MRNATKWVVVIAAGLLAGCGGHSGSKSGTAAAGVTGAATPAGATSAAVVSGPGSYNLLGAQSGSSGSASPVSGSATPASGSTTPASGSTTPASGSATPASGSTTPASGSTTPASGSAVAPAPAAPSGPQLYGTIPATLTTGFDGTLFLVGEQLVPGSFVHVAVNGVPTKVLPATFYSSETLGVYVYLTVPADYTFTAVAPDGTTSTPATFTVSNGGVNTLFGLNQPEVHMVYPPALNTQFVGTVWLMGDHFMPGSVVTVSMPGLPPYVAPLQWVNQTTVGWITTTPLAGDVTLQVTNPTLMTSTAFTVTVGQAQGAQGGQPQAYAPTGVQSPFAGSVHLVGSELVPGALVEWRLQGATTAASVPLVIVSSAEAWWTLIYPAPGQYEFRVVNPSGAATGWQAFEVR